MSNIQFPVALKPLLTNFVVNVLRDRIPSDRLPSYAAEYFSNRQNLIPSMINDDGDVEQTAMFLTNQIGGRFEKNEGDTSNQPQRRKSVWGGSPVEKCYCCFFSLSAISVSFRILIEI